MPRKIDGISLSDDEYTQWNSIYDETGDAAMANAGIQKRRKNTLKELNAGSKFDEKDSFSGKARSKQITNVKNRNKNIMDQLFPK